jgi:hypothetical protein
MKGSASPFGSSASALAQEKEINELLAAEDTHAARLTQDMDEEKVKLILDDALRDEERVEDDEEEPLLKYERLAGQVPEILQNSVVTCFAASSRFLVTYFFFTS